MGCGTLAALALTGAGTGASLYAGSKERSAQEKAVQSAIDQQRGFGAQTQGLFNKSLAQSTPEAFKQQQQQGAKQFGEAQNLGKLAGADLPITGATIGQDVKNRLQQGSAAQQFGMGYPAMQQYLKNLETNTKLGVFGNEASSAMSTLPLALQGAGQSYAGLGAMGSLLGTAGQLVGVGSAIGGAPKTTPGIYKPPFNPNDFLGLGQYTDFMPTPGVIPA